MDRIRGAIVLWRAHCKNFGFSTAPLPVITIALKVFLFGGQAGHAAPKSKSGHSRHGARRAPGAPDLINAFSAAHACSSVCSCKSRVGMRCELAPPAPWWGGIELVGGAGLRALQVLGWGYKPVVYS